MVLIQAVLLMTGALMIVAPGALTRKSDRNNPEAVKKTKTMGNWLFIAAIIWVICSILL